ncbi:MAG: FUSC family protein [Actinomycetia bacterium]|nr:FUSC family protein [Actinomycetes bacterium]
MPAERPARSPIAGILAMRPAPRRWPLALRVSISTAIPILIGWAAGDIGAGLIASLGAFTADYGTDRPYLSRGAQSAIVAVSLAAAVTVGAWAAGTTWLAVLAVSAVAVVAVWLCSALSVGPPGAYMFVLVCAAGIGFSASHLAPIQIGLLVLAGGAVAWVAQMSAALVSPRGPETAAVAAAGEAVAGYLELAGTSEAVAARRGAAAALSRAWVALVDQQPRRAGRGVLRRLREANHALHVLFTDTMFAVGAGGQVPSGDAATARAIGALTADPAVVPDRDFNRPPLHPPPARALLAQAVRPGAHTRQVMTRVAVAVPLAGAFSALLGFSHVYWAMAAAVLMLHQGTHRRATFQRAAERLIGTSVGLGLAAVILSAHPQGLWLVLVVSLLQFAIELTIVRNYALATVFITAIALTIATGTHRVDVLALLVDRGVQTALGCGVGIAVYLCAATRQEARRFDQAVADTLDHTVTATAFLARGDATSLAARGARRELQESVFRLNDAEEAAGSGAPRERAVAARLAPVASAAEQLGYATVTACWAAERDPASVFRSADADSYLLLLTGLAQSMRTGAAPRGIDRLDELPAFAAPEVAALTEALRDRARSNRPH